MQTDKQVNITKIKSEKVSSFIILWPRSLVKLYIVSMEKLAHLYIYIYIYIYINDIQVHILCLAKIDWIFIFKQHESIAEDRVVYPVGSGCFGWIRIRNVKKKIGVGPVCRNFVPRAGLSWQSVPDPQPWVREQIDIYIYISNIWISDFRTVLS